MGMLYRKDIFDKHGIAVRRPGTSSPRRPASSTPPTRTSTSPTSRRTRPASGIGLLWQAGAKPFETSGRATSVIDQSERRDVQEARRVLGRPDQGGRRSPPMPDFTDAVVPGAQPGQVRHLAHRRLGPGLPRRQRQGHHGQVAGGAAAAVGRRQARLRQLGRLDDGRHHGHEEPDRGGQVRRVPQHRSRVDEDVRDRAVLLPGDQGAARGPEFIGQKPAFYGGQKVNQAVRRTSATPSTPTSSGRRSSTRSATTGTRPSASRSPTRATPVAALDQWQYADSPTYAKNQGFKVEQ